MIPKIFAITDTVKNISCYRIMPSATWKTFSEFLKIIAKYEKRGKYIANIARGNVR